KPLSSGKHGPGYWAHGIASGVMSSTAAPTWNVYAGSAFASPEASIETDVTSAATSAAIRLMSIPPGLGRFLHGVQRLLRHEARNLPISASRPKTGERRSRRSAKGEGRSSLDLCRRRDARTSRRDL